MQPLAQHLGRIVMLEHTPCDARSKCYAKCCIIATMENQNPMRSTHFLSIGSGEPSP